MGTIDTYYKLATEKLCADGKLVALFTKHSGTIGGFREARLRAYLKEHAGKRFHVGQGFVAYQANGGEDISDMYSRQIDCLIYDPLDRPALLETDDFSCVTPRATAAVVEVKSTLSMHRVRKTASAEKFPFKDRKGHYRWGGTLVDALQNISCAIQALEAAGVARDTYFAGILAYDALSLKSFQVALKSGELLTQLGLDNLDHLPDCVCVLGTEWWSFEAYPWNDIDPEWDAVNYDPGKSFWIKVKETDVGTPLRFFTSYLAGKLEQWRGGEREDFAGLRSGGGTLPELENVRFDLTNGRGPTSNDPVTEVVADLLAKIRRQA